MSVALRDVTRAVVWKGVVPAATLTRTTTGVLFAYLPDYAGPDVARTLPRDAPPLLTPAGAVPPLFRWPPARGATSQRRAARGEDVR